MQNVDFRDGKLRFRLPKKWTAEYQQDGGALFREPDGMGVLFLTTIEVDAPEVEGPLIGLWGDDLARLVWFLSCRDPPSAGNVPHASRPTVRGNRSTLPGGARARSRVQD